MKSIYLKIAILSLLFISCSSKEEITTYYLIRHAEKDRSDATNTNPSLTFKGEQRAQNWAIFFKDIPIDAVYSTKYFRTIETATPTAKSKNLEVLFYNPRNMYDSIFKQETKGKTVLIVGHSNTTPAFANKIINENNKALKEIKPFKDMDDNDNATLLTISFNNGKMEVKSEKIILKE